MKKTATILFSVLCSGAMMMGMVACSSGSQPAQNNPFGQTSTTTSSSIIPTPTPSQVTPVPTPSQAAPVPTPSQAAPTPQGLEGQLVGTWHMNLNLAGMDEATAQQYQQMFAGVSMTMILNADGSSSLVSSNTTTGESQNQSGTWTLADNTVTLTLSTGESEHYTYENGQLKGVESYIIYFTK
jgi:hypothetical protein